ncbi:hypothetical protein BN1221_02385c [Brenneria goodwinii]|uniref:Uncharacterized protein n=1 Tax=Brenneria goodwinii TaxID=1109412 RepID=A0A0G4JVH5_9GAMM|nr:hypothetical protein BN1221_02385c [Brenneria goodwinii]
MLSISIKVSNLIRNIFLSAFVTATDAVEVEAKALARVRDASVLVS